MPGIIKALAGSGTPFSILTKGTLLRRDLPLLSGRRRRRTDRARRLARDPRRRTPRGARARHAGPAGAARAGPCDARRGPAVRRHARARPALADGHRGAPRQGPERPQGGRRHRRDGAGAAPAARCPGVVLRVAGPRTAGPGQALRGALCTGRQRPWLLPTVAAPPGCSRSSSGTASPDSVAARCGASPATRTPSSPTAASLPQATYQQTRQQLSSRCWSDNNALAPRTGRSVR